MKKQEKLKINGVSFTYIVKKTNPAEILIGSDPLPTVISAFNSLVLGKVENIYSSKEWTRKEKELFKKFIE